jgi:hypothetical protein
VAIAVVTEEPVKKNDKAAEKEAKEAAKAAEKKAKEDAKAAEKKAKEDAKEAEKKAKEDAKAAEKQAKLAEKKEKPAKKETPAKKDTKPAEPEPELTSDNEEGRGSGGTVGSPEEETLNLRPISFPDGKTFLLDEENNLLYDPNSIHNDDFLPVANYRGNQWFPLTPSLTEE